MSILNLLDRPIAFNRSFVDLGVGITGALMLSQCVYWSTRTKNSDGWFYKSREEWMEETGLTRREQETARRRLCDKGYIEESKRGVPCRVFFKLNREALENDLLELAQKRPSSKAECAQLESTKAPSSDGGKRPTNTESTAETTTENTQTPVSSDDVTAVFEFWKTQMGKTRTTKLDTKRRTKIKNALADYGIEQVQQAITGCTLSAHHMGQNPQNKRYDDIELILRDAKHVEQFLGYYDRKPTNVSLYDNRPRPVHTQLDQANDTGLRQRADGAYSL
tara:strand:+ start:14796 stop:15629 length:834 start_codon:yes stop_codon:yes gene_type:complete